MKVLVAEDDKLIREGLCELLQREGYETLPAADGRLALELFRARAPALVLLDIMMPGLDGYGVCREIRRASESVPVIFISAKSEEIDKVLGLELGADDYIIKPFGSREVIARIRAVTRRYLAAQPAQPAQPSSFTMADLTVYPAELRARRGKAAIELSLRDVKILELLHQRRGQVVDRDALFDHCWGRDYLPSSRTLDQHISKLRRQVELDPQNPVIIRTVYGVGYRFE